MPLVPAPQELPLRDIHLPDEIGFWPLAPGWWLLLAGILLAGFALLLLVRYWQGRRYKRLALRELNRLENQTGRELAVALSRLLRRAALCHFERNQVAGLSGEAWLAFLDRPFADAPFSAGVGQVLADAPYRPATDYDAAALRALCRSWLQKLPLRAGWFRRGR